MKLVLISGKMGSGKTSLQQRVAHLSSGMNVVTMNFADVIYEMHNAVLDILHDYWPKRPIQKDGPLLQVLGTQWGRETIDQNIWVKIMREKIQQESEADLILIGDCRFENELYEFPEALKVRLECPESVRKARCSMWRENSGHASEVSLDCFIDNFDLVLDTEALTIDECAMKVLEKLGSKWVESRK